MVTVLSPLSILNYSYHAFTFDHEVYRINEEVLPAGSFERRARTFADPVQISMVRTGVDLLRIRSTAMLILRVGTFSYTAVEFSRQLTYSWW